MLFSSLIFFGCNKPDPTPWLKDPVYIEMSKRHQELKDLVAAQDEELKSLRTAFEKATPQTGQSRNARAKLEKQILIVDKLKQQLRMRSFALNSRIKDSQDSYMRATRSKKPWPNEDEIKSYLLNEELAVRKRHWNDKDRIAELRAPASKEPPKQ